MKEPKLEKININKIKVDVDNPNKMTEAQFESLKKTIEKYGYLVPIIVDKDFKIADGEHRYLAYKDMGMKEIPAYVLDIADPDRRILRQVMNKLRGEHDYELDLKEFSFFQENDNLGELADLLPDIDMNQILDDLLPESEEDDFDIDKAALNPKYEVKRGDVWLLGDHRLLCGDATNNKDVELLMDGKNADMVFTDPPYGLGGYAGRSGKFEAVKGDELLDVSKFYNAIPNVDERYIWGNWEVLKNVIKEDPRDVIIWYKNYFGMGRGYRGQYELCFYYGKFKGSDSDVWEVKKDNPNDYLHPTQKPVELAFRAIKNSSKTQDLVLDIYIGSGATLIACERTNRRCYAMDIEPKYCSVTIERWEKLTGKKAIKK